MPNEKLKFAVGMCKRAGKLVSGTPNVCEYLRSISPHTPNVIVLEASDTSPNTHKRLTDKSTFYGIRHEMLPFDGSELARATGKSGTIAAVCVTDANLTRAVLNAYAAEEKDSETE